MTCFFAEGTQARGCVVRLERSGGVVYQMIPRVNETANGLVRTEFSVDCYNISVVDWEEDGSIGSLDIYFEMITSNNCFLAQGMPSFGATITSLYSIVRPSLSILCPPPPSSTSLQPPPPPPSRCILRVALHHHRGDHFCGSRCHSSCGHCGWNVLQEVE